MSDGIDSENHAAMGSRDRHPVGQAGVYGFLCAFALLVAVAGCSDSDSGDGSTKINGSIHVPVGKQPGAVATVNGSIHIDDNAAITSATTVNGSVHLGDHATATSLNSVNGSIVLGADAHASGSVSSVNGEFELKNGSEISGALSNVNGQITLNAAHVGGGIKTVNGSINITGASHVDGGILVEKPSGNGLQILHDVPRIVIGPGATVQGELRFERTVQLYVSDKATIGTVTGATPISFTGDTPPK
jgi:acetyltransferase-like isoleucine patch superfamily enzyme